MLAVGALRRSRQGASGGSLSPRVSCTRWIRSSTKNPHHALSKRTHAHTGTAFSSRALALTRRSCYIAEIAQELAMNNSQNVWVDGSLRDGDWYGYLFKEIRRSVIAAILLRKSDSNSGNARRRTDSFQRCSPGISRSIESRFFTFPRRKKR